jgi:hypothetical protein
LQLADIDKLNALRALPPLEKLQDIGVPEDEGN